MSNITRNIDGVVCELRDAVFSDFGAITPTEKAILKIKSSGDFVNKESRSEFLENRVYSWNAEDTQDISNIQEPTDSEYADAEDRTYADLQLNNKLLFLRRPLHIQLRMLVRGNKLFYKQKKRSLKNEDLDLLIENFRYELHVIIAKAKTKVIQDSQQLDMVLRLGTIISGGNENAMKSTLRKLTLLFKRAQKMYETTNAVPKNIQIQLNDLLSILVSNIIIDVYGEAINKLKMGNSEEAESKESNKKSKRNKEIPGIGKVK